MLVTLTAAVGWPINCAADGHTNQQRRSIGIFSNCTKLASALLPSSQAPCRAITGGRAADCSPITQRRIASGMSEQETDLVRTAAAMATNQSLPRSVRASIGRARLSNGDMAAIRHRDGTAFLARRPRRGGAPKNPVRWAEQQGQNPSCFAARNGRAPKESWHCQDGRTIGQYFES